MKVGTLEHSDTGTLGHWEAWKTCPLCPGPSLSPLLQEGHCCPVDPQQAPHHQLVSRISSSPRASDIIIQLFQFCKILVECPSTVKTFLYEKMYNIKELQQQFPSGPAHWAASSPADAAIIDCCPQNRVSAFISTQLLKKRTYFFFPFLDV